MEDSEGLPSDLIDDMGMRDERRAGMDTERESVRAGQLDQPKPKDPRASSLTPSQPTTPALHKANATFIRRRLTYGESG